MNKSFKKEKAMTRKKVNNKKSFFQLPLFYPFFDFSTKKGLNISAKSLFLLVAGVGFEPTTFRL